MRTPRTTTQHTFHRELEAPPEPVALKSYEPVLGASWRETTAGREHRRNGSSVEGDEKHRDFARHLFQTCLHLSNPTVTQRVSTSRHMLYALYYKNSS